MASKDFAKADDNKNRLELIQPEFILGLGEVLTFGAKKYAPNNWMKAKPKDIERIKGATLRHQLAYMSGEKKDPETGISHLHHISCNLMFLDYFDRQLEAIECENALTKPAYQKHHKTLHDKYYCICGKKLLPNGNCPEVS